jgi:hypothetical protein
VAGRKSWNALAYVSGVQRLHTFQIKAKASGQIQNAIRKSHMSTNKDKDQKTLTDVHPFLEKMLIETYMKGYTLEELQSLPEEEAKRLMKEASTHASGRLAEVEVKAHLMQVLHDAYSGE